MTRDETVNELNVRRDISGSQMNSDAPCSGELLHYRAATTNVGQQTRLYIRLEMSGPLEADSSGVTPMRYFVLDSHDQM